MSKPGSSPAVPAARAAMVALREALGLVLAADVIAGEDVPPFANTAMDGYAVRAADTGEPCAGAADGWSPISRPGTRATMPVGPGEAIRIMTGAPMPDGADAIVMVERTERDGDRRRDHLGRRDRGRSRARPPAAMCARASRSSTPGRCSSPAHLGVLASLGFADVPAYPQVRGRRDLHRRRAPRGSGRARPGQIRDSNRPMLLALVAEAGAEPIDLGIGRDDEAAVTAMFRDAAASCDAIITSGGVSVGDYDVVKAVLGQLGVLEWWQVAIKPAKPLAFGLIDGTPIFGLPGNPVSSHVSFELFARPALRQMMGHARRTRPAGGRPRSRGPRCARRADGKLYLDRVRVHYEDDHYVAVRSGAQASNVLAGMALGQRPGAAPRRPRPRARRPRPSDAPHLPRCVPTEPELAEASRADDPATGRRRGKRHMRGSARGWNPPGTWPPARSWVRAVSACAGACGSRGRGRRPRHRRAGRRRSPMTNAVPVPEGSGSAADDAVVVDRAAASATGAAAEAAPSLPGSSGGVEAALPEPIACRHVDGLGPRHRRGNHDRDRKGEVSCDGGPPIHRHSHPTELTVGTDER